LFVLPFERSLFSNFCFFKICWKSLFTIIRNKQKIYVIKMELYDDVCYSIYWYLNNRAIKYYLPQFSLTFSSFEKSQNRNWPHESESFQDQLWTHLRTVVCVGWPVFLH
jgi:hypothetical protein